MIMNKNIANIVNCGDRICATLDCHGRRLASVNGTCFSSLGTKKEEIVIKSYL